jgi:Asp-tRNA(Asn)/Glu-tRNA(Gln) amidotransferase A subunit family amidase
MGPDVKGAFGSQKGPEAKPIAGYTYVEAVRKNRVKLIEGYSSALAGLDALLVYTTPLLAPPIGDDVETELNGTKVGTFATTMKSTDPVSIVGFPAISVPAGYSSKGLPIGLQIIARPWEENKLLNIAYAFEQATRVRKPPKLGTSS